MTNKIRVKPKKIILEKNKANNRLKVLFLASWYPSDKNPISGIFIKRHAEAVSKFCDVVVLFVIHDLSLKKLKLQKTGKMELWYIEYIYQLTFHHL